MAFVGKPKKLAQQFETPEEMYSRGGVPRTPASVGSLWIHQGDVLRAYAETHQTTPDLALELPTGTGKTLPGLLIAEWTRRKAEGPVLYATPTKQLARQVAETAKTEGVPARVLVGSHHSWGVTDQADVEGGQALAITTYSSIFNSSPKLPASRLIVFDDAHAGEQYVGDEYGVTIRRHESEAAYLIVLHALRPFLSGLQVQRLEGQADPGAHHQVRLILPAVDPTALAQLDAALAELPEHKFQLALIRSGLTACCVYLSYGGILIRPMIPPTFNNKIFSQAQQRIYLSATLGSGGELERAFGRQEIVRMPLSARTPPRSGRRLFVFPDLVKDADSISLAKEIVGITKKALALGQASEQTNAVARTLAGPGVPVLDKKSVENGLAEFAAARSGVLALANRYDGLDLPDNACRIVVLSGKPDTVSLQERFLSERAEASVALSERLRTRIVQGAGRCTRGPNDFAVVLVMGSDMVRYFSRPENISALEPELQAELQFGWENSTQGSVADTLQNVRVFLEHGEDWLTNGEPIVADFREDAVKNDQPSAVALGNSAKLEVAAWKLAFTEDWLAASQKLEEAARSVGSGGEATRGYRGLLLYLAGVWLHHGSQTEAHRGRARQLVRDAASAAERGTWLKEMKELSGTDEAPVSASDSVAVNAIVAKLMGRLRADKVVADLSAMRIGLDQEESGPYELALTALGTFLGATAQKPPGQGRCDSAWMWDTALWITIEAKSEEHGDGLLPLKDIRQANTQLDQLVADQKADHAPAGSPTILVSDRLTPAPEHASTANANVYLTSTEIVRHITGDVDSVWRDLLAAVARQEPEYLLRRHVQAALTEHGCLPTQVADRLCTERIRPLD